MLFVTVLSRFSEVRVELAREYIERLQRLQGEHQLTGQVGAGIQKAVDSILARVGSASGAG
jgi:hypothetical protein